MAKPFLKWVGGKRRLMKKLEDYFPKVYNNYYEPFLGGGSVFFNFTPSNGTISDLNEPLINTYRIIRDDLEGLLIHLEILETMNNSEDYYRLRGEFNNLKCGLDKSHESLVRLAALMIYLNKAGFGGLYRENKKGMFNASFGKYKKLNIADAVNLKLVSDSLGSVKLKNVDYLQTIQDAKSGDFIYLDPPYDKTFTKYQKGGFTREHQTDLANVLKSLDNRGVKFLLSNSNTEFINELYGEFNIVGVTVGRNLNNNVKVAKKSNNEVIVMNY
jgi:DNA adenine methylase